ncbi:MAG: hypothetical protein NT062_31010 [Proteobacteria bacterium]|nr:hypothetical protein [Pseudomonadota bacterium]
MIVGTPSYMAPEQCTGGAIDARTDLYACGVLMYELLTGVRPFTSATDDPVEVVTMHIRRPPPTLADAGGEFGPELEQIVARALAKRPADRFETATAFSAALDVLRARLISGPIALPTAAPPAPPVLPPVVPSIPELAPPIAAAEPVAQAAPLPAPRPTPSDQPIAWIPLDRRQLKITGIVLGALLVLVVVAIAASSKRSTIEPPVATGSSLVAPTPAGDDIDLGADPAGELLARAQELADAGNPGQALDLLIKGRVNFPTNAPMAYLAGKLYFARLYWNDGLAAFRTAIRLDPAYQSDAELIKTVLRGFITTPSYNGDLASFLRNDIGVLAEGFLEDTAKNHPVPGIRARAAAELKRYR